MNLANWKLIGVTAGTAIVGSAAWLWQKHHQATLGPDQQTPSQTDHNAEKPYWGQQYSTLYAWEDARGTINKFYSYHDAHDSLLSQLCDSLQSLLILWQSLDSTPGHGAKQSYQATAYAHAARATLNKIKNQNQHRALPQFEEDFRELVTLVDMMSNNINQTISERRMNVL
jgi:hypothetical protein